MKLSLLGLPIFLLTAASVLAVEKPNVVFILADDLGLSDTAVTGSKFYQTPNIDRLAQDGMIFRDAYSACTVCSPTRASLLTGKNPAALRLTDWIPGRVLPFARLKIPDWTPSLSPDETTLADYFKQAGYATATIGKWHLGDRPPTDYGFDLNIAGSGSGHQKSYFSPYQNPLLPNGPKGESLNERLTDEAIKWIEANKDRPFFLYLPHFAVHTPIQARPDVVRKYEALATPDAPHKDPAYAALIESLDDSVGRIRTALEKLGLSQDTIIVFTSDNGGLLSVTKNLGARGGKGSPYEGGVRVPLIYYWPGHIPSGSSSYLPVITGDHLYTFTDLLGQTPPASEEYRSLVPILFQKGTPATRDLFWHYPHYDKRGRGPYSAIRSGDLKLIEFFDPPDLELYNLEQDPTEQNNLAPQDPATVVSLHQKLQTWRTSVQAQLPTPNPDYDPANAGKPAPGKKKSSDSPAE